MIGDLRLTIAIVNRQSSIFIVNLSGARKEVRVVSIVSLWLPILLSAAMVFVVSSLIHMVLGYHAGDWRKLPNEVAVLDALRRLNIPPGDYLAPRPDSMAAMKTPEFQAKMQAGPLLVTTVRHGPSSMGRSLALWFAYSIV